MTNNLASKILVVDDIPKNIQLVAQVLTREGFIVDFAQSGDAALKHVSNNVYDLIFLDIMMPEMDGFEVCRRLKTNQLTAEIPVIFITAKTDAESIAKAFELGGVDYITKPFIAAELVARAKTHITIRKQRSELQELISVRDKLFSIIGHDLRGPIGSTSQMLNIILADASDFDKDKLLEILNLTRNQVDQVYYLLENLLDWTAGQRNKMIVNIQQIDILTAINESISILSGLVADKNLKLQINNSKTFMVLADERMLKTILRNLISNAIKFSYHVGIIVIDYQQYGDKKLRIKIIDQGTGMSTENVVKLLTSKEGITSLGTSNEKGTGLGIRLCREFLEKMYSQLMIESFVNQGSIFSFVLPITE